MPRERLFFLFFFFFANIYEFFSKGQIFLWPEIYLRFRSRYCIAVSEERKEKREKIDLRFNDYNKVTLS